MATVAPGRQLLKRGPAAPDSPREADGLLTPGSTSGCSSLAGSRRGGSCTSGEEDKSCPRFHGRSVGPHGLLMPTKPPSFSRLSAHRKAPTSGLSKKKPIALT